MTMTAALAAALQLLSESLDDQGEDLVASITRLAGDAQTAIPSFSGLTVRIGTDPSALQFTVLTDGATPAAVASSVRIPLAGVAEDPTEDGVFIILYASTSGAFVDLAADVTWLTGQPLDEMVIDEHQHIAAQPDRLGSILVASTINQAIGVLLAQGRSPEQAQRELADRAVLNGVDVHTAALEVLAHPPDEERAPPAR